MTIPRLPNNSRGHRVFLWIIWGTLVYAAALYGIVLRMMVEPKEEPADERLGYIFGGLALVYAGAVLYIRFGRIGPLLRPGPMMPAPNPDEHLLRLGKLRFPYLLCFVLTEAVVLNGFVLSLLNGDASASLPFFALGGVLFAFCYPRVPPDPLTGPTG